MVSEYCADASGACFVCHQLIIGITQEIRHKLRFPAGKSVCEGKSLYVLHTHVQGIVCIGAFSAVFKVLAKGHPSCGIVGLLTHKTAFSVFFCQVAAFIIDEAVCCAVFGHSGKLIQSIVLAGCLLDAV